MAYSRTNAAPKKRRENLTQKVVIGPCRISFPHFFEPAETDNGDKYQGNFLFPPDWKNQPDYKKFQNALYDVAEDMFGPEDEWPTSGNFRGPKDVIRKAEEKDYEGYRKGWFFVKAGSKDQPGIVDAGREPVTNPREVYGGRWCRISVTVAAYDNKSKGVGIYLNSIQVLDHDEPFGGRGPAKNDFDDWQGAALSDDDRGTGRGNARPRDEDDEDERPRSRDREDRRDDRRSTRRDDDEDRPSRARGRDRDEEEDDRPRSRGRDRDDEDDRPARGRDRDEPRSGRRDRDEDDRPSGRRSARDDDDRPSRRARDDDEDERPSRRGGRGSEDRAGDWN